MGAVFGDLYALGLAVKLAGLAVLALFRVNDGTEHGKAGEEAQRSAHGADGVAIGAPTLEGQHNNYHQGNDGYHQGGNAFYPYLLLVEGITACMLRPGGQQVVAPEVNGLQEVLHHASISAVRSQKGHKGAHSGYQSKHKQGPYAVAQPFDFLLVLVRFLALVGAQPGNAILENAQRADDGAIYAAEDQRKQHQGHHYAHIQGQESREKLDLGHPAQVAMQRAREIQEQEGDPNPENPGQHHSKFL